MGKLDFVGTGASLAMKRQKTLRAGGLEGRVRQELCKVLTGE